MAMQSGPKLLITLGIILVIIGVIWHFGARWIPLGRLPGDVVVEKENFKFYFPIVTCIVISIVLSLIMWLFRFIGK
jgi:hypothetical protein